MVSHPFLALEMCNQSCITGFECFLCVLHVVTVSLRSHCKSSVVHFFFWFITEGCWDLSQNVNVTDALKGNIYFGRKSSLGVQEILGM